MKQAGRFTTLWLIAFLTTAANAAVKIDVMDSPIKDDVAQPGEKVEGHIDIVNRSEAPQQVKVYQTDFTSSAGGTFSFGDPGSVARSNSSWLTFTPRELVVPAKGTAQVFYAVQVPDKKDLSGSYWSVLLGDQTYDLSQSHGILPLRPRRRDQGARLRLRCGSVLSRQPVADSHRAGSPRLSGQAIV